MKKMAFELALKGSNNKIYYFLIIYYVLGLLCMLFSNPHNNSKQGIITPLLEMRELKIRRVKITCVLLVNGRTGIAVQVFLLRW